jgi:hypothetical protein
MDAVRMARRHLSEHTQQRAASRKMEHLPMRTSVILSIAAALAAGVVVS